MSDEQVLQNDAVEAEVHIQKSIENPDNGADLATASVSEHEQQPKVEESADDKAKAAQSLATEAINKQHKKFRDQERIAVELQQQLDVIRGEEQERLADSFKDAPLMPEMPSYPTSDAFDEGHEVEVRKYQDDVAAYNDNMPAYYQKLQEKANYDAQQTTLLQSQQFQQQQVAQAQQVEKQKLTNSFYGNAISSGASNDEVNLVVNTLNNMNISSNLGDAIMSDTEGYFVAKYLAGNPMELHELNTINPILAGAKLAEIKQKASALKPITSKTPVPVDILSGKGAQKDLNKFPNSKEAKFY